MHKLTKLGLSDMEDLPDEPQLVSKIIDYIKQMTQLEELSLENSFLEGKEIESITAAIQQNENLMKKLKKISVTSNKQAFNTQAALESTAEMISRMPRFCEMQCKGTGFAITSNYEVKVRTTNKDNLVNSAKPILVKAHIQNL